MSVPVRGSIRLDKTGRWLEEISRRIIALEKASGGAASVTPAFVSPATPAFGSGSSGGSSTTVITGATDHGALTGLGDDDHPWYLEFLEPAVPRPHVHGPDDVLLLDHRFYRRGEQARPTPHDHHHSTLPGLESVDHPLYQRKHGFETSASGAALVTITYDKNTRKITLTPTGSSFRFWIDGREFRKVGAQVSGDHAASTNKHFFYYDANGVLQTSTVAWSILDRTVTPVAVVYYYTGLNDGICFFECHTADRWLEGHYNLHFSRGTQYISGMDLTGYTPNTDTDVAVTYAVGSGVIADEDIRWAITGVADGGPYTIMSRTGAGGDWTWDSTPTFPFLAGTYPRWNNPAGPWTMVDLSGLALGEWCNYYVLAVTSVTALTQVVIIPGQAAYSTLSAALSEGIQSLSWGTLPFEEIKGVWKVTLHARSTYGGTYKTQIQGVTSIKADSVSVTGGTGITDHGSLSGLEDDDHPHYVFMARIFGG